MKKLFALALVLCMLMGTSASAESAETVIVLSDDQITVDGSAITEDTSAPVHLARVIETHEDVPENLKDVENRVVTITDGGVYRLSGTASDIQIAVKAGDDDDVRLILDNVDLTCRTASVIAIYSAHDPRIAGEYGVTIELAAGSDNRITGSHNSAEDPEPEFDGAIGSQVSLGFEGSGSLTVDADNEGVEVAGGHMTINGGVFHISACDDPLNVSEDGVGVLTVNDGYLYSAVKPLEGGEGDGIDSNGWIVFNGGTAINLAHPASGDGGIDSDMGSSINGGVIVGAGNMYDPIESASGQLFMMLEFGQATNDLVVVTDAQNQPVFAYDFPHDYMYIAFSTPDLKDGETYHVYLGGEIEGTVQDGLYTAITSYVPGTQMQHGDGNARQRMTMAAPDMGGLQPGGNVPEMPQGGFGGQAPDMGGQFDMNAYMAALAQLDLNELLKGADLNELLKGKDLNSLLTGFAVTDLLTDDQIKAVFGDTDISILDRGGRGMGGGFGGPRGMESSADVATTDFVLTKDNTGFTNVVAAE
ncbi:MAG: carbohydrate-binding domain-containing protein [Clostridia bacterium]|nr:carbohydrate-binding domain-containing protein [Clostridia bacterium]